MHLVTWNMHNNMEICVTEEIHTTRKSYYENMFDTNGFFLQLRRKKKVI